MRKLNESSLMSHDSNHDSLRGESILESTNVLSCPFTLLLGRRGIEHGVDVADGVGPGPRRGRRRAVGRDLRELYKNMSSRKIDSQRLFSKE